MQRRIEHRKHKRFQPIDGLFAVISSKSIKLDQIKHMSMAEIALKMLKSKPTKMGQIIDISKGGLAFWYIHEEENSGEAFKLAITYAENAFYSNKIKFETISDFEVANGDQLNTFTIRRQGLKFKELTLKQISVLDRIIRNYTIGDARSNNFFDSWFQSSLVSA